ncbi:aspartate aminotransferase family protein [Sporosarcina sp. Marseille-Q4063]|uniref:aminotransferase family protein n=1 Tax=Sporosarcina sp. Marseille-Q4063 TaxID=2810514 RepID=UPI001BAECB9D|nr:aspartate aminotransferase family protein [Sporosarcina sp. Marseille-Q4063]QUW22548.1 aspartate aminotransferase family protein [Sporosarcina sp. Marseille-Q4063]
MTMKTVESVQRKYEELAALDKKHFMHPTSSFKQQQERGPGFIFTEGKGIYLKDIRGKQVIDGLSSLWNVNIGHGREELGQAAMEQMKKLAFSSAFATNSHEPVIKLAEKVAQMTPGDLTMTFFTSGGSDANDTAFKTARYYWQLKGKSEKKKIISRQKSYHGVSVGASSATGLPAFRDFPSLAPDFYYVDSTIESLKELIAREGAETIAAFISEPVQGSGGVNLPPPNYFKEIREICDQNEILFIADEVITGFGRTGKNFGMENFDAVPDMMVIAKGISSGYAPLGGMVISEKLKNELIELTDGVYMHGYTYSGHPMCCAVALKNLEIIEEENLIENVLNMGAELQKGFKWLEQRHEEIGNIRGIGLLGAVEILKDKETNTRFSEPVSLKVVDEALKHGLLGRAIIYEGQDTLAFAPPFCINKQEVETIISIIDKSLTEVKMAGLK